MAKPKRLERLLRVRTLQLGQVQAQEATAAARLTQEAQLGARITALAENITPRAADTGFASSMAAAAYYRDRLHGSACRGERRMSEQRRHARARNQLQ
jgi:flagellar protein FliJ